MNNKSVNGTIMPLTEEEELEYQARQETDNDISFRAVRNIRDKQLLDSDFTQLDDYPANKKAEFKIYRQALRDIPQVYPDSGVDVLASWKAKNDEVNPVDDGKWPDKPGGDN